VIPVISQVEPKPNYRVKLRFDDGQEGEVDIASLVTFTGVFEPLKDPAYFARVMVHQESGTIVWPNGADLDPVILHDLIMKHPQFPSD